MMDFKISVGSQMIMAAIAKIPESTRRGIRQGLYPIGDVMWKHARKNIIRGTKTGNWYRVPGRASRHRASAPGQSPANMLGNLQKAVGYNLIGAVDMKFGYRETASNGVDVPYGRILELGGTISRPSAKGASRQVIEPRPNLSVAVKAMEKQAEMYLAKSIEAELKKT